MSESQAVHPWSEQTSLQRRIAQSWFIWQGQPINEHDSDPLWMEP